tara:strand:+ start:1744 stop:2673 length:930 start_codon:yes stop_codon:yes gene_type:complete
MEIYHTYANVGNLRDYLAGTSYSSNWTADTVVLRRMLQTASRRMDNYVGGDGLNTWGPYTATRVFDIGKGSYLRNDPRLVGPIDSVMPDDTVINIVPLGSWCNAITSVTSYKQTARTENETLTSGYANDYFLLPYNTDPKTELKLNEDTAKQFYVGQKTLEIVGTFGWQDTKADLGVTLNATINDSVTALALSAGTSSVSEGNTILIGTEQMYVESVSGVNLTVVRGVHGTTAAAHTGGDAVEYYTYPSDVVETCLDLARIEYRNRDMGVQDAFGTGDVALAFPVNEARNTMKKLDRYVAHTASAGVVF